MKIVIKTVKDIETIKNMPELQASKKGSPHRRVQCEQYAYNDIMVTLPNPPWHDQAVFSSEDIVALIRIAGRLPSGKVKICEVRGDGSGVGTTRERREMLHAFLDHITWCYKSALSCKEGLSRPSDMLDQTKLIRKSAQDLLKILARKTHPEEEQIHLWLEILNLRIFSLKETRTQLMSLCVACNYIDSQIKGSRDFWKGRRKKSLRGDSEFKVLIHYLCTIWVAVFEKDPLPSTTGKGDQGAFTRFVMEILRQIGVKHKTNESIRAYVKAWNKKHRVKLEKR